MTVVTRLAAVLIAMFLATTTPAHAASDIAGIWWTPDHDGKIEIVIDATGAASGRVIALTPVDAAKRDDKNPDPALRGRTALGLPILRGFRPDDDSWSGGTVYDPESGNTYRGTLSLDREGRLRMRGYVGISWFGRTEILTRVAGPSPRTQQPGEPMLVYLAR